jgi:hypothetical protein
MAMSSDILATLRVSVAGQDLHLEREVLVSADTLLRGIVPAHLLSGSDEIPITFHGDRTIVPRAGTRTLAVALRELRLEPVVR